MRTIERRGLRLECVGCGEILHQIGSPVERAAKTVGRCCAKRLGLPQAAAYRAPGVAR